MNSFAKAMSQTKVAKPKAAAKKEMAKLYPKDDHIKHQIDAYQKAKKEKKKAEAVMDNAGADILEFAGEKQDIDGYAGNFRNAYQIDGFVNSVKYVSSNRFSINATDVDQLHELFDESFGELIEENYDVSLKDEVFKNQELQDELMALVGERFADFFETKVTVKVKPDFDKNIYKVVDKDTLPTARTFCRPYKPSLR